MGRVKCSRCNEATSWRFLDGFCASCHQDIVIEHAREEGRRAGIEEAAKFPIGQLVDYRPSPLGPWFRGYVDGSIRFCGETPCVRLSDLEPGYREFTGTGRSYVPAAALDSLRPANPGDPLLEEPSDG